MRLGAFRVITVSTVSMLCGVVGPPIAVLRPHRDVATSQGLARGYFVSDPPHYVYYGLPYAYPPTRRDRFKAPKPPPQWDGIFEATHKLKCPQLKADGEEYCLVVNVFTPEGANSQPVLVFVHGGDYQNGWGAYQSPTSFINAGFVIVTFNYRLGALGFLCLGIPEAPGNAGLKDQIAALYWVHRNIARFGGNPRDVTVYGTGAGAVSIQLGLLSGLVKGLLHRVILESGSVLSPLAMVSDSLSTAYNGALSLGYEKSEDPYELYKFYEQTSGEDLATIPNPFRPCVENESDFEHSFIDLDPLQKLTDGNFYKVPMLITMTHKDKSYIKDIDGFDRLPEHFEDLLPNNLAFPDNKVKEGVGKIVRNFYFGENYVKEKLPEAYIDYVHDILIEYPITKMAVLFAAQNTYPVYVMQFTLPREGTADEPSPTSFDSVLDYLYSDDARTDDNNLEKLMVLLKNFIKFGDPTPLMTSLIPLIWQPVDQAKAINKDIADVSVLHFYKVLGMGTSIRNQRLLFWDNIYNKFYKPYVNEHAVEEVNDKDTDGSGED